MKIRICNKANEQASLLIIAIFTGCVLGIILGSYLLMIRAQHTTVVRSQTWNGSMVCADAGVEEALAQLNPGATVLLVDRTANDWGSPSDGFYGPKTRTLSGGSYSVTYTTNQFPIIYSTGYVTVPLSSTILKRVVRVATTNVPLFSAAVIAI